MTPARPGEAPHGAWTGRPYFVALGTIEPRKNHALLLDIWEGLTAAQGNAAPHLLILGSRGWRNADVFARLDAGPAHVHELPGLDDSEVAALLADSRGLLFPSLAEGFGLPPAEALSLGVPALCNTLPVLREVLGDQAIYADSRDSYTWQQEITRLAGKTSAPPEGRIAPQARWSPPDWTSHFTRLLSRI